MSGSDQGRITGEFAGQCVSDIGELALVDAISARLSPTDDTVVGPGDDAAVLSTAGGCRVVVSVDTLVEGVDFRRDWSTAADIGHHAMAAGLADLEAMGARCVGTVVALVLPDCTALPWVLELVDGMSAEAQEAGCSIVGGDLSGGEQVMVSVTVIGESGAAGDVTRSGARAGDVVAVAGRLGWAAAGLMVLSRGFRSPKVLVDAHRRPRPPYGAGGRAASAGATAMIDVSDGLITDVARIARASRVGIDLSAALVPLAPELASAANAFNIDPLTWALNGGDDHALVATFPPDAGIPDEFVTIGRVFESPGTEVTLDSAIPDIGGYEHFRR
ncbi:MAG: thiamine-phosphate kinase [Candidatus Nanopelagicales bacterium]|nr:thiamine-phosphate kinase [Candidatus Nanopelagicales bacterium]